MEVIQKVHCYMCHSRNPSNSVATCWGCWNRRRAVNSPSRDLQCGMCRPEAQPRSLWPASLEWGFRFCRTLQECPRGCPYWMGEPLYQSLQNEQWTRHRKFLGFNLELVSWHCHLQTSNSYPTGLHLAGTLLGQREAVHALLNHPGSSSLQITFHQPIWALHPNVHALCCSPEASSISGPESACRGWCLKPVISPIWRNGRVWLRSSPKSSCAGAVLLKLTKQSRGFLRFIEIWIIGCPVASSPTCKLALLEIASQYRSQKWAFSKARSGTLWCIIIPEHQQITIAISKSLFASAPAKDLPVPEIQLQRMQMEGWSDSSL